jgi:FKBP-type peptidyl-prolyl cis-trans isomerase
MLSTSTKDPKTPTPIAATLAESRTWSPRRMTHMTQNILALTALSFAASLTACDPGAAKPTATETTKVIQPAKLTINAATLPGAPATGEGTDLGNNVLAWTLAQGTGEMLPIEPTTATMNISAWSMSGKQFFGGVDGPDELVLPTSDDAAFSGWSTAISDMKVGEIRKVWISKKDRSRWPLSDSPQDVVMDIELVSIGDEPAMPSPLPGMPIAQAARNGSSSGLRWYDVTAGNGAALALGDTATIRVAGWYADGTPWHATGAMPVSITLDDSLMPALSEGLFGMKPGSERKLIVPPTLGAGYNPLGTVPPGSTLIIDIEYIGPTEATASADNS